MLKVVAILGGVFLVVVLGVYFLFSSLDSIVESMIEEYGTKLTGTRVSVDSVDISLSDGRGRISGVHVGNPDGFPSRDAFYLSEISVDIDVQSLSSAPIVIEHVLIDSPIVSVEKDDSGRLNLEVIKANIDSFGATQPDSEEETGVDADVRIRIDEFGSRRGLVRLHGIRESGQQEEVELPSVELNNVGGQGGAVPAIIGKEIMVAFVKSAGRVVARKGIEGLIERELGEDVGKKAGKILEKVF